MKNIIKKLENAGYKVNFLQNVDPVALKRCHAYWFIGKVAEIEKDGIKIVISNDSPVDFVITKKSDNSVIAHIKDLKRKGTYLPKMEKYIPNDYVLTQCVLGLDENIECEINEMLYDFFTINAYDSATGKEIEVLVDYNEDEEEAFNMTFLDLMLQVDNINVIFNYFGSKNNLNPIDEYRKNGYKITRNGKDIWLTQEEINEIFFLENAVCGQNDIDWYLNNSDPTKKDRKILEEAKNDPDACVQIHKAWGEGMYEDNACFLIDAIYNYLKDME